MKVLIPIEDENLAEAQLNFVLSHKWPDATEFLLLNTMFRIMIDPKSIHECKTIAQSVLEERHYAEEMLRRQIDKLQESYPDADIKGCVNQGLASETIVEIATNWHADVIVLGSHGRKDVGRAVLGSVAYEVLTDSPCHTVIVGLPKSQRKEKEEVPAKETIAKLRRKESVAQELSKN